MKQIFINILKLFFITQREETLSPDSIKSILVVRQHDQLGDMLCVVPLLRALRNRYASAHITLVASPVNYEIMRNHPYTNEVLNYNKPLFFKSPFAFVKFFRVLRTRPYNLAVVPSTVSISFTSNLISLISGAGIRIGPDALQGTPNTSKRCFTHTVLLDWKNEPRRHQTLRNLDILKPLQIEPGDCSLVIGLTKQEEEEAILFLKPIRKQFPLLIGIHPGAGKRENRWNAERFASIANRLHKELNAGIVITAGPMDDEPLKEILNHLSCPYTLIQNTPLRKVAALIDQLSLYITNDTGVMHIAGATRTNVLSLFGPTDPLQWAPIGSKNHYIGAKEGELRNLSVEEVFSMAELILKGK